MALADYLLTSSFLFLGMLSFASVSLLFLVIEELLVESRESAQNDNDMRILTISLFVGIFIAFAMSLLSG